jgi:hypothetical protein
VLGLAGWGLTAALSGDSTAKAPGSTTTTSHSAAASGKPSASAQPSHTAVSKAPPSASASPSAPATSASPQQSRSAQLISTIVDYYRLMPGNVSEGWNWMTPSYQQNHAGGWNGYTSFWSNVQRVTATDVTATLPSTATATIDYYYKNGTHARERTQFGLVSQQGRWLIDTSSVLG